MSIFVVELLTVLDSSCLLGAGFPFTTQVKVTELPLFAGLLLAVSFVVLSEINATTVISDIEGVYYKGAISTISYQIKIY